MISPLAPYKIPPYRMPRRFQSGQTLIIALLILGVLLILAGVFAGILNSAIRGAGIASDRATVSDFSEAGIRFAHSQLLNSELGADWRGTPTTVEPTGTDTTRDPDAYYLRPPATTTAGVALTNPALNGGRDQGGPDGLGPFFRVNFDRGRALVRVRYAPGDPSIFSASRVGGFLTPGKARNMIVIESVGRNGLVLRNDPTQSRGRGAVQFRNFASQAAFEAALGRTAEFDGKEPTSRKLVAFAQIGLIDTARYITNKFGTTRPADIGAPSEVGARLSNGAPVQIQTRLGNDATLYVQNAGGPGAPVLGRFPAFGSLFSNADLRVHGNVAAAVNPSLGDGWAVAGRILSGSDDARLLFRVTDANGTGYNVNTRTFDAPSSATLPNTGGGILRDDNPQPDVAGFARGVGRKAPPTMLAPAGAPEGTVSRYVSGTRDSGVLGNGGNSGAFGHGSGVYVDNGSDFQTSADEASRQIAGTSQGLVQDWLNPFGDGVRFRSGWRGPFYIPVGAYVRLLSDGFAIARNANPDQRADERTWRRPDGSDSGLATIRYRIGRGNDGELHVVNTLTPGLAGSVDAALSRADFSKGPLFNGVLYFEGNVRVRGTIPTDVQLTLVTNRTAYIEGSILKGTVGNDVTSDPNYFNPVQPGARLQRRSRSALMLIAKDYVAVNTTMFAGPASDSNVTFERGTNGVGGYSPSRVAAPDGSLTLLADLPLMETGDDPSQWPPLATTHRSYTPTNNGTFLSTRLMLTHTLESTTAGPTNVFETLTMNPRLTGGGSYLFDVLNSRTNSARAQYATIDAPAPPREVAPVYGLGLESWQQSAKFETIGFPIVSPIAGTTVDPATGRIDANDPTTTGVYSLLSLDTNELKLDLTNLGAEPTGNLLVARTAVTPGDIRIEASVYAEDGSFFVIPGDWFNPNPNDRRDVWDANFTRFSGAGQNAATARVSANEQRLNDFGATPDAPFYGEPLDVKVTLVGSVAENMPPPIAQQAEWEKKWGWIPLVNGTRADTNGTDPLYAPSDHVGTGLDRNFDGSTADDFPTLTNAYVPNLTIQYDPALATGRVAGFAPTTAPGGVAAGDTNPLVRYQVVNGAVQTLPPMPRLPVSPTLAYFGEAK